MDASLLKQTEFAAIDREAWVKLAQKALKGADFDKTLISRPMTISPSSLSMNAAANRN